MPDNEASNYPPELIRAVRSLLQQDENYQRTFNSLVLKPDLLPPEEPITDPWKAFTLQDAYIERPPAEYIAAGLFTLPSLSIVYGAPGTLKSFVMADLAVSVAAGKLWLPPAPWQPGGAGIETKQAPVMWLDFDNGELRTHERFGSLARARDLPESTPIFYYSMPMPWLDASKPETISQMILRAKEKETGLIVIDNLGLISGGVDENSAAMISVMSQLRQLAEGTAAAVVVIHHQRKGNGFKGRAGDTLRGHSSIEAAIDLGLLVEREEGSDTITMKSTKTRGQDVYPFSGVFTYEHIEPGRLYKAMFYGLPVIDTNSTAAIEKAILEALEGESMNQTELVKAVKETCTAGENRIIDMIKRLQNTKKIKAAAGPHNSRVYELV